MATYLTTYYGNTVTAGSKQFRVVAELYSTQENSSSGYYLQVKYYVQVLVGQSSAFTKYFQVSWNSGTDYALSTAGTYATKTVDLGWVGYGLSKTITASGQYEGGSGTIYKSSLSGTYTVPAKSQITVQFNANGGTGAPSSVSGTAGYITLPSTVPTREGHTFMGWTARSASGYERLTSISSSGVLTNYSRPTTFDNSCIQRVAVGRVNSSTFEVLVYASGASSVKVPTWTAYNSQDDLTWHTLDSGSWTRGDLTYNFGAQISTASHLKAGNYNDLIDYIMHVYAYDSSGNAIGYVAMNSYFYIDIAFLPSEAYPYDFNLTLYAQWTANTYVVQYDGNGSTSGSTASSSHVYDVAKALTTNGFVKNGYNFIGWNTKADGSGVSYSNGVSVSNLTSTNNETITLYAQWDKNSCVLTLDPNGGKVTTKSLTLSHGTSNYSDISWNIPSKIGYDFMGWYTAKSDGIQIYDSNGIVVNDGTYWENNYSIYNSSYTLYAHWEEVDDYDIYIYSNLSCSAIEFIESDTMCGFDCNGRVYASSFIETDKAAIGNNMYFDSIIER